MLWAGNRVWSVHSSYVYLKNGIWPAFVRSHPESSLMSSETTSGKNQNQNVGMSQIVVVPQAGAARSVLGSCIGLVLFHSARKLSAFAHIVLPDADGRNGPPGKFADTAIPHMLELLHQQKAGRSGLVAKMAGGASMFGSSGPIQIGKANCEAVVGLLDEFHIPVIGRNVGGQKGRRVTFDGGTGELRVEIAGEQATTI